MNFIFMDKATKINYGVLDMDGIVCKELCIKVDPAHYNYMLKLLVIMGTEILVRFGSISEETIDKYLRDYATIIGGQEVRVIKKYLYLEYEFHFYN